MMLQLDIGNTRIKWRSCDGRRIVDRGTHPRADIDTLVDTLPAQPPPNHIWVASVAGAAMELTLTEQAVLRWGVEPWYARSSASALGLRNSYAAPERMGVDRWLAMLAAWKDAGRAVCVIDAGSALTIDFVSADGEHMGGYILPGLDSMERALLSDTDRVRFGEAARDQLGPGRSTEEAVFNGILLSQAGAVAHALDRQSTDFQLYYSGGNGLTLHAHLRRGGVYEPDLVLAGLQLLGEAEAGSLGRTLL